MLCNPAKILFHQETKKNGDSSFECHQSLSNMISYTERSTNEYISKNSVNILKNPAIAGSDDSANFFSIYNDSFLKT